MDDADAAAALLMMAQRWIELAEEPAISKEPAAPSNH
jgi:hypothetical protein